MITNTLVLSRVQGFYCYPLLASGKILSSFFRRKNEEKQNLQPVKPMTGARAHVPSLSLGGS